MEAVAVAAAADMGFNPGDLDLHEAAETWVNLEGDSPRWDDSMLESALAEAEEMVCWDGVAHLVVVLEGRALLACLEVDDVLKRHRPSDTCCITFSDEQVAASLSYHLEAQDAMLRLPLAEGRRLDLLFSSEAPSREEAQEGGAFPSRQAALSFYQHAVVLLPLAGPRISHYDSASTVIDFDGLGEALRQELLYWYAHMVTKSWGKSPPGHVVPQAKGHLARTLPCL